MFDDLRASINAPRIRAAAEDILHTSHLKEDITRPPLGKMWPYDFLKHHREFFKSRRNLKEVGRGASENRGDGCYANAIEAYSIQPPDIYNMDKPGF
jgi:hypothetical protein